MNINEISYDPSNDEILGFFKNKIHVKVYDFDENPVVLIMSKKLFHKTWDNWLDGKRKYCEKWNDYCGVMGYTHIEDGEIIESDIYLNIYDGENVKVIKPIVIKVRKFSDIHDFEHG